MQKNIKARGFFANNKGQTSHRGEALINREADKQTNVPSEEQKNKQTEIKTDRKIEKICNITQTQFLKQKTIFEVKTVNVIDLN